MNCRIKKTTAFQIEIHHDGNQKQITIAVNQIENQSHGNAAQTDANQSYLSAFCHFIHRIQIKL